MNHFHLGWRLGAISSPQLQRYQYERCVNSITPWPEVQFDFKKQSQEGGAGSDPHLRPVGIATAHSAGTSCLTIDKNEGNALITGGADGTIHFWNLACPSTALKDRQRTYRPTTSLTRNSPSSHTHAITSISIYPFDPVPTTLLSTSHDKSLKITAITPHSLQPLHTFSLHGTPYVHHQSPLPSSQPLIALATSQPQIPLIDLRTTHATHLLPGHTGGSIYTLRFSPVHPHLLATGNTNGQILLFDIRRATPAMAALDADDSTGILGEVDTLRPNQTPLNYTALAHAGPVTTLLFPDPTGRTLLSAGHDQRIRLWDMTTGRNELVHFGPRVRNNRVGELAALVAPSYSSVRGASELLFWPNDDGRGEIHVHGLREGNLVRILRTPGVSRTLRGGGSKVSQLTSGGRINGLAWRWNAIEGTAVEMYSAHGDGRVVAWRGAPAGEGSGDDEPVDDDDGAVGGKGGGVSVGLLPGEEDEEGRRRKKRRKNLDMLEELVQGLTGGGKKEQAFSWS